MNFQETPEDAARRFAERCGELEGLIKRLGKEIDELQDWQRKYEPAAELFDALILEDGDIVLDMILLARSQRLDDRGSVLSIGASDQVDYSRQLGMLHEAILVMHNTYGETEEREN